MRIAILAMIEQLGKSPKPEDRVRAVQLAEKACALDDADAETH